MVRSADRVDDPVPGPHGAAAATGDDDIDEAEWHRRYHELPPDEHPPAVLAALLGTGSLRDPDFAAEYPAAHLGSRSDPAPSTGGAPAEPELVWRNMLGGQTWRLGDAFLKWTPRGAGVDLDREARRLRWLEGRHPAPRVLDAGHDDEGQWMLTAALAGETAVEERWRRDPERAVLAIAEGLVRLHALPVDEVPVDWDSWATREPPTLGRRPPVERAVVVHGDACSPNTLVDEEGRFVATVDVGDLAVADAWADLAVASMAIGWNYGPGWDATFYDAYGVRPDPERIAWYRALWDAES